LYDLIRARLLAEGLIAEDNVCEWYFPNIEGGMVWLCAEGWALVLIGRSLELRVWPTSFNYAGLTIWARLRTWMSFIRKRAVLTKFSLSDAGCLDRLVAALRQQTKA
jgi:hypothetical protein